MGIAYNTKKIVTGNLVLYLDAANSKSYPGSGTSWSDLNNLISSGTLTNGTTYSSSNNGYMSFDGVDDFVSFGDQKIVEVQNKSVCAWIYRSADGILSIIDKNFDSGDPNYGGWGFWLHTNNKLTLWVHRDKDLIDTGNAIPLNTWTHVAFSYSYSGKSVTFYINGAASSTLTDATLVEKVSNTTALCVGSARNGSLGFFNGRIGSVIVYGRTLSASEILHNYIATKARFGV